MKAWDLKVFWHRFECVGRRFAESPVIASKKISIGSFESAHSPFDGLERDCRVSTTVVMLGSGPSATEARQWDSEYWTHLVAINNAWRVRSDWDMCIFPEDLPVERRPSTLLPAQQLVEADDFVPVQNQFGGVVYAGGTMAFTAAYWALGALQPDVMAFFGCDLVYPASGPTHFYGQGTPDPLRDDVTLQSLEAKSARLQLVAAAQGCACVNISEDESRLVFPRARLEALTEMNPVEFDQDTFEAIKARENALGYYVDSGRYWECVDRFDAEALAEIDALWLDAPVR